MDEDKEVFDVLVKAAVFTEPLWGRWTYELWWELNETLFGGKLRPIPIIYGLVPHGSKLGILDKRFRRIVLHSSLLDPRSDDPWEMRAVLGPTMVSQVVVHQMAHQWVLQVAPDVPVQGKGSHNNSYFVDEVNRLAELMGLPGNARVVRQRRIDGRVVWERLPGFLSLGELAVWPYGVRPKGYFSAADEVLAVGSGT